MVFFGPEFWIWAIHKSTVIILIVNMLVYFMSKHWDNSAFCVVLKSVTMTSDYTLILSIFKIIKKKLSKYFLSALIVSVCHAMQTLTRLDMVHIWNKLLQNMLITFHSHSKSVGRCFVFFSLSWRIFLNQIGSARQNEMVVVVGHCFTFRYVWISFFSMILNLRIHFRRNSIRNTVLSSR